MKFTAPVLHFNRADGSGDIFPQDVQVEFPAEVPVTDAGAQGHAILNTFGKATLARTEYGLVAEIELAEGTPMWALAKTIREKGLPLKMYPSVNGMIRERDGSKITKCSIRSIDIGVHGNSDPTIPPLEILQG